MSKVRRYPPKEPVPTARTKRARRISLRLSLGDRRGTGSPIPLLSSVTSDIIGRKYSTGLRKNKAGGDGPRGCHDAEQRTTSLEGSTPSPRTEFRGDFEAPRTCGDGPGGNPVPPGLGVRACGRPARGDSKAATVHPIRSAAPSPPRCDRIRQDVHHGSPRVRAEPSHPRLLPQQNSGGPALPGVPEVLPRKRGGVLRLLLRLLPARGLRSPIRHVHREG